MISVGPLQTGEGPVKLRKWTVGTVTKYFCKKGMSLKEIHDDFIKTLGDESPSYSRVKKWAAEFRTGRDSMEDNARSGHPKEASTNENIELVLI